MHDEIWCLMRFSMRAMSLTKNKHAKHNAKKSISAPSGLRLQLDPNKSFRRTRVVT